MKASTLSCGAEILPELQVSKTVMRSTILSSVISWLSVLCRNIPQRGYFFWTVKTQITVFTHSIAVADIQVIKYH